MGNKQIIILIIVVFIAFVGYKAISSNIQENKEKAVLQEKYQLQELAKEPLNQCLENIDANAEADIKRMKDIYTPSKEEYEFCINQALAISHSSDINALIDGKITIKEYCKPPSFEEIKLEEQKIRNQAKIDKEECYKRYK